MSIRGINKNSFEHLIEALNYLERLQTAMDVESEQGDQLKEIREELFLVFGKYEKLIQELCDQVAVYQDLYYKVKFRFLPEKLKALRRTVPETAQEFILLRESIRKSYGS
ncbi:hypothetical protein [Pedobacter rhizosphaerae]|uniref:RteC protein n=1 Tax=Pedobacter rhizosphaerae TaxID=390241 RepID=A0A1H9JYY3_9SPHI|nr:hypothetical protein [Pedobacter rhizosphaerae]SEQ92004.1 hypothetical protein SAMN04488023_102142 [Pedobacter rhizosphaerae]